MGKTLNTGTLSFFMQKMNVHTMVERVRPIPDVAHHVFELARKEGRPITKILYSDAYEFGDADMLFMPSGIDFVLITPHSGYDDNIRRKLSQRRIGIGDMTKLMAALNVHEMWTFRLKSEKKKDEEEGWAN